MAEKKSLVAEMVRAAGKNLLSATPLTREGMAKGLVVVGAELRGGLLDLQRMATKVCLDGPEQATVLGMIGVPTPGMVDDSLESRKSIMGYELPEPERARERERERGM